MELIDQATLSVLIQAAGLAIITGIQKQIDWKCEQTRKVLEEVV